LSTNTDTNVASEVPFSIKSIIAPLMAVVIGMFMVILDSTVVNVALPRLVEDFNSTLPTMQWTVAAYTLALSAVIPLAGWMTDHFGAKRIFLFTIAFFTVGSVLCSIATTPGQLILYRVLQGLGGGMVAPIGMAMIFKMAPPGKIGSVMAVLGVPMMLAPASGPILSGWLVEYASWHWIFLINLPVGIAALLVGIKFLPKFETKEVPSLDLLGMLLAPVAFATLAYAVQEGGTSWTSTNTVTALLVGGVALFLFIIVELRHKQPLLELRVFGSSDFTRGTLLSWLMQIALFGSFLLVPYFLQNVMGYSPLQTGLILLPQALSAGLMMPVGGRLYDKLGARPLVITGLSIITIALFMLSRISVDTSLGYIMGTVAMMGGGMGMSMMPLNTHILQSAPRRLVSRVTPLTTAAQQVMVSFAVAGLTGYLTSRTTFHMPEFGGNPFLAMEPAFGDTFFVAACIAVIGVIIGFILRKPKMPADDQQSTDGEGQAEVAMTVGH